MGYGEYLQEKEWKYILILHKTSYTKSIQNGPKTLIWIFEAAKENI